MSRRKKYPRPAVVAPLSHEQHTILEEIQIRHLQEEIDRGPPSSPMVQFYGRGPDGATCGECQHFRREWTLGTGKKWEKDELRLVEPILRMEFNCEHDTSRYYGRQAYPEEPACIRFCRRRDGEPMYEYRAMQLIGMGEQDALLARCMELCDASTPMRPMKNAWGIVVGNEYRIAPQLRAWERKQREGRDGD